MKMYLRGSSIEKGWETLIYNIKKWENGRNSILLNLQKSGKMYSTGQFSVSKGTFSTIHPQCVLVSRMSASANYLPGLENSLLHFKHKSDEDRCVRNIALLYQCFSFIRFNKQRISK
jgi:hypothetical protein